MTQFAKLALEIITHMFSLMYLDELMAFASPCRTHRVWVMQYLNRRKDNYLIQFVSNPSTLLDALRITSSVISGSLALQFLLPAVNCSWGAIDMDIYSTQSGYETILINLLLDGYTMVCNRYSNYYTSFAINRVIKLVKGNRSIDIIVSQTNNVLLPILHFHSTVVMNYLSADSFFSAYPMLTIEYRGLINRSPYNTNVRSTARALAKYQYRGFSVQSRATHWDKEDDSDRNHRCESDLYCPRNIRATLDRGCARYCFEQPGIIASEETADVCNKSVVWQLGGEDCQYEDLRWYTYVHTLL
ncbi:hypothetical protein BJ138DRAFT_1236942 [Hygrophoropsis aurantiaca]|uniref:Uncharacterized protein n=1 Tax=Hygrophoropsis aurantiaca TaxID=72124 RepID=A0ACB7ZTR9_9AGAM|nr:hypothetical protein BJ138DRAFT_1236942 [Hygrophoropsis aurantiaca]